MSVNTSLSVVISVVVLGASIGGYYVFTDDRYFHVSAAETSAETLLLAQAKQAVALQIVAKESRLRDIEGELRDIEKRKASAQGAWAGDADRYATLLSDRAILIERLEELK